MCVYDGDYYLNIYEELIICSDLPSERITIVTQTCFILLRETRVIFVYECYIHSYNIGPSCMCLSLSEHFKILKV